MGARALQEAYANPEAERDEEEIYEMHKTPKKVLEHIIATRPYCERRALLRDHYCRGRSTNEHALYYANRQIPDEFAVIRLCAFAHSVDEYQSIGILNKEINEWIAISHATEKDFKKYPNFDWHKRRNILNKKYGCIIKWQGGADA